MNLIKMIRNIKDFINTDSEDISISLLDDSVKMGLLKSPVSSGIVFGLDEKYYGVSKFIDDVGAGYIAYSDYGNNTYIINKYYINNKEE